MAHCCFIIPPSLPPIYNLAGTGRRQSSPVPQLPQSPAEMNAHNLPGLTTNRNDSLSSSEGSDPPSPVAEGYSQAARQNSGIAAHRNPSAFVSQNVRTRSIPGVFGAAGVIIERDYAPPRDEDVIIVTVRLTNKFRKSSVDGAEDLPSRPPRRGFLRRISTRVSNAWDHAAEKEQRYKAVKMPRGEYKRHFRRDKDGNYVGTEPERQWDEDELMREYADYQGVPLHSITC